VADEAMPSTPGSAPAHWEGDVVLADGGSVHVRPLGPDDTDRLVVFHAGLADETVFGRFFSRKPTQVPRGSSGSRMSSTTTVSRWWRSWATGWSASLAMTVRRTPTRPKWRADLPSIRTAIRTRRCRSSGADPACP
jgi:hypothetical protein